MKRVPAGRDARLDGEPDALAVEPNFDDLGVNSEFGRYVSLERLIEQNKVRYGHPEATLKPPSGSLVANR